MTTNATVEIRERRRARMRSFLTFFTIVLAVYGLINAYIFIRTRQAIPVDSWIRPVFTWLFIGVALSYFIGEYIESRATNILGDTLVWIGALWLGTMTWALIACVLVDLARLLDHFFQIFPTTWHEHPVETRMIAAITLWSIILIGMFIGFMNARSIRVKPLAITINKRVPGVDSIRIAMLSDMHLGSIVAERMTHQMVDKINSIHPDLVLMAGDQIDGNPRPSMDRDLGRILEQIRSTHGVYAITGNHEYIGDAETSCAYLAAHGITMIRDTMVEVAGIQIVGREDRSARGFAHHERKSIDAVMQGVDSTKPIILLDHQPFHLEEAEQHGADLQLSGHTHHAQLWPWSFITRMVYEVSWGYKKKGNTHIYVSCGAGTWGPPIRLGNTPEIMDITLHFAK